MTSSKTKTKYPVICSPMYGLSDVKLAVACSKAGILPSLIHINSTDFTEFENNLKDFSEQTNGGSLLVGTGDIALQNPVFLDLCKKYNVSMLEIIEFDSEINSFKLFHKAMQHAASLGFNVSIKLLNGYESAKMIIDKFGPIDFTTFKSPKGGGRGLDHINLEAEIIAMKRDFPEVGIIASGGINTASDVAHMLSIGADYVSLGTIFCACEESCMSLTAKEKIINSDINDLGRLTTGALQKALIFSIEDETTRDRNINNNVGLDLGLSTGTAGHIFVGDGISKITKIEPLQEIVDRLVAKL